MDSGKSGGGFRQTERSEREDGHDFPELQEQAQRALGEVRGLPSERGSEEESGGRAAGGLMCRACQDEGMTKREIALDDESARMLEKLAKGYGGDVNSLIRDLLCAASG
jgi:hypothetical protein